MAKAFNLSVLKLDPRAKLILIIVFTTMQMLATSNVLLIWNYFLVFLLFLFSDKFGLGFKTCFFAVFMICLQWVCHNQTGFIGTIGCRSQR